MISSSWNSNHLQSYEKRKHLLGSPKYKHIVLCRRLPLFPVDPVLHCSMTWLKAWKWSCFVINILMDIHQRFSLKKKGEHLLLWEKEWGENLLINVACQLRVLDDENIMNIKLAQDFDKLFHNNLNCLCVSWMVYINILLF